MSGIGLSGSHGTGKSTLAEACVEAFGIQFVRSEASRIIREAGYSAATDYDFETRLHLQELILDGAIESYEVNKYQTFITDRTPLDFLTYLMTDIGRNNVSDELAQRLASYRAKCYKALNRYFNVAIILQPGIPLVAREGRGSPNLAYAEHFTATITGLACNSELTIQKTTIPRHVIDLDQRVSAVDQSLKLAFRNFDVAAKRKGALVVSKGVH